MSGAPERASLTSAARCPDGAAGGGVGRTQGARVTGSLVAFGCGHAPQASVGPAHVTLPTG
jgi:hypothetical protein